MLLGESIKGFGLTADERLRLMELEESKEYMENLKGSFKRGKHSNDKI